MDFHIGELEKKKTKSKRPSKREEVKVKAKKVKVPSKKKLKAKVEQHALALSTEKKKSRVSKTKTSHLKSIIGDSAEDIQQMLESGDTDNSKSLIYKKLVQTVVDLLPYAENNIRKSKGVKGVYQLNSMVQTIRELIIDVQASQDRGRMGELMTERIIAPAMLDIGTSIVQKFSNITADAKVRMTSEEYRLFKTEVNKHRSDLAEFINKKFYEVQDQMREYLQR